MASFKITKKPLSIILSVLIFIMSITAVGVFSISADAAVTANVGDVVYFEKPANWTAPRIYLFNNNSGWEQSSSHRAMTPLYTINGKTIYRYVFTVKETSGFLFDCNTGDDKYQTENITSFTSGNIFYVSSYNNNGKQTPTKDTLEIKAPGQKDLTGSTEDWDTGSIPVMSFKNSEYTITYTTKATGQFSYKIYISYDNGDIWFPDGYGNNFSTDKSRPAGTKVTITFKESDYNKSGNGVSVTYEEPTANYVITFDGKTYPQNNVGSTVDSFTHSFSGIGKGSKSYSVTKNGTSWASGIYTVKKWDTTVNVKCYPKETTNAKKAVFTDEKTPTYEALGIDGSEAIFGQNTGTELPYTKDDGNNNIYEKTFEVAQNSAGKGGSGHEDQYSYRITKNGGGNSDFQYFKIPHDNSKITVTCTVSGINTYTGSLSEPEEPTYTCDINGEKKDLSLEDSTTDKGASPIDNKRYEITFDYNHETEFSITGSKPGTVSISSGDRSKDGTITIFYNETADEFQYTITEPPKFKNTYGDLNQDGKYNVIDAYMIRKIAEDKDSTASELQKALADVNEDNEVTIADVTTLNEYIVGNIEKGGDNRIGDDYTPTP